MYKKYKQLKFDDHWMRILNIFCRLQNKAYVILLIKSDVSFQVKTSQRDILQLMKFNQLFYLDPQSPFTK